MAAAFTGFQSLVENSPDAISLINEQGEILYGSASNTKLFGYRPDELIGRDCMELIHPEDREHSSWSLQQAMIKPAGSAPLGCGFVTKMGTTLGSRALHPINYWIETYRRLSFISGISTIDG